LFINRLPQRIEKTRRPLWAILGGVWSLLTALLMFAGAACLRGFPTLGATLIALSLWAGMYTEGEDERVAINLVGWVMIAGLIASLLTWLGV
jgi:hypothetical protein